MAPARASLAPRGLPASAFADREDLNPRSQTWWAWKLCQDGAAAEEAKRPAFVPVEVMHGPTALSTERFEVVLPGGTFRSRHETSSVKL